MNLPWRKLASLEAFRKDFETKCPELVSDTCHWLSTLNKISIKEFSSRIQRVNSTCNCKMEIEGADKNLKWNYHKSCLQLIAVNKCSKTAMTHVKQYTDFIEGTRSARRNRKHSCKKGCSEMKLDCWRYLSASATSSSSQANLTQVNWLEPGTPTERWRLSRKQVCDRLDKVFYGKRMTAKMPGINSTPK